MKKSIFAFFASLMVSLSGFAFAGERPEDMVKRVSAEVLDFVKKDAGVAGGDRRRLLGFVEKSVLPHFDFERMTRVALGRHWKDASDEQRRALVDEFRATVVRTYSNALASGGDHSVEVKEPKAAVREAETVVKTVVKRASGEPIPVDYDMERHPAGWKVVEVTVAGVRMAASFRNTYGEAIAKDGIDGLIAALSRKNKDPSAK